MTSQLVMVMYLKIEIQKWVYTGKLVVIVVMFVVEGVAKVVMSGQGDIIKCNGNVSRNRNSKVSLLCNGN